MDDALVLFVDDRPDIAEIFTLILRKFGYTNEIVTADNGIEALDCLARTGGPKCWKAKSGSSHRI